MLSPWRVTVLGAVSDIAVDHVKKVDEKVRAKLVAAINLVTRKFFC